MHPLYSYGRCQKRIAMGPRQKMDRGRLATWRGWELRGQSDANRRDAFPLYPGTVPAYYAERKRGGKQLTAALTFAGRSASRTARALFFFLGFSAGGAASPSAPLRAGSAPGSLRASPAAVISAASPSPRDLLRPRFGSGPECQGLIRFITVSNALRW